MPSFTRPESLEFPKIYTTFKSKDKNESSNLVEYRIQDLAEGDYEKALHLMRTVFLRDEALSFKIYNSKESAELMLKFWKMILSRKFSLGCYRNDGSNDLVGVNILRINSKDDEHKAAHTDPNVKQFVDLIEFTFKEADIFTKFNESRFLDGVGLVVDPEYRRCGLATELIRARVPFMKCLGINLSATSFNVIGSQEAARKAGFEDVYVKTYAELSEINPNFEFVNNREKIYKIMALKI